MVNVLVQAGADVDLQDAVSEIQLLCYYCMVCVQFADDVLLLLRNSCLRMETPPSCGQL